MLLPALWQITAVGCEKQYGESRIGGIDTTAGLFGQTTLGVPTFVTLPGTAAAPSTPPQAVGVRLLVAPAALPVGNPGELSCRRPPRHPH